jgi:hypothetical protein
MTAFYLDARSTTSAHDHWRAGGVSESGGARAPAVLRGAQELPSAQRIPLGDRPAVVEVVRAPQSTRPRHVGAHGANHAPRPPTRSHLPSLSILAACGQDLRQEPDAVIPHVRICAGGAERSASLPRPLKIGIGHTALGNEELSLPRLRRQGRTALPRPNFEIWHPCRFDAADACGIQREQPTE